MSEKILDGRRIIITGGASGMGEGLVRAFPDLGARVVSMDLTEEAGQKIALESEAAGFVKLDVTNQDSVISGVAAAVKILGGLDVLIHAAGIAPSAKAEDISLDLWSNVLAVNATGTFLMNQAVFPYLKDKGGAILNFASAAGIQGYPNKAAYAAAKGAVLAWNRSIAQEWGKYNISVNAIAPAIWTPMYDKTRSEMSSEQLIAHDEMMSKEIPLGGKLGDIQKDFVPVLAFLASKGAHFMTGQVFPIDGGVLMMR
ncbi:MAG: SDR family NAD(P)-dependent oxidoreductase [Pseudomonadota bacterium]